MIPLTKLKSARTLMAIILISVCGWAAVVVLVIKPPFWLGAILSFIGGIAIAAVVAYLIRRWWFRLEEAESPAVAGREALKEGQK